METDGPYGKVLAVCVVVAAYIDKANTDVDVINLWRVDMQTCFWAFLGGDILRGTDRNLYHAAQLEFHEKEGICFGIPLVRVLCH